MGWTILSGPPDVLAPLADAMGRLVRARLCPSHPVQWAIKPALEGPNPHIAEVNAKLRRRRRTDPATQLGRAPVDRRLEAGAKAPPRARGLPLRVLSVFDPWCPGLNPAVS